MQEKETIRQQGRQDKTTVQWRQTTLEVKAQQAADSNQVKSP
jgi:hypothetical protein